MAKHKKSNSRGESGQVPTPVEVTIKAGRVLFEAHSTPDGGFTILREERREVENLNELSVYDVELYQEGNPTKVVLDKDLTVRCKAKPVGSPTDVTVTLGNDKTQSVRVSNGMVEVIFEKEDLEGLEAKPYLKCTATHATHTEEAVVHAKFMVQ